MSSHKPGLACSNSVEICATKKERMKKRTLEAYCHSRVEGLYVKNHNLLKKCKEITCVPINPT